MESHTKGPWLITKKHEIAYLSDAEDQSYGMSVPIGDVFGENVEANGLLIAAAPDLLEALDMIHKSFGGGNVITFSEADIAQIGAAIAKATGTA